MISITKPSTIPKTLTNKGVAANIVNCNNYSANPRLYINGKGVILIDQKIYGGKTVKSVLKKAQFKKCCFCEKKQGDEYGAVEHYRPKAGYRLKKGGKLIKPGYYWQGYNWDNLYFVCSTCNTTKGNYFPLQNEFKRAKNHRKNINAESPYILNPGGKIDPRKHIVFDYQYIKGKTIFGKKTIQFCGLDRESLNDERQEFIDDINTRLVILAAKAHHKPNDISQAEYFIKNSISKESKFSAMAIDYLKMKGVRLI